MDFLLFEGQPLAVTPWNRTSLPSSFSPRPWRRITCPASAYRRAERGARFGAGLDRFQPVADPTNGSKSYGKQGLGAPWCTPVRNKPLQVLVFRVVFAQSCFFLPSSSIQTPVKDNLPPRNKQTKKQNSALIATHVRPQACTQFRDLACAIAWLTFSGKP